MTRYSTESAADLAERLADTARRNPEALLVIAAGCALLLRNRKAAPRDPADIAYRDYDDDFAGAFDELADDEEAGFVGAASAHLRDTGDRLGEAAERAGDEMSGAAGRASRRASAYRDRVSRTAEAYGDQISRVAGDYYETAGEYASSAAHYASEQSRRFGRRARRFAGRTGSAASHVWHDQPLAVLGVGLAAGAAIAALIPPTETEERALRPARDVLAEAAAAGFDRVRKAAFDTARDVREDAEERGFTASGAREMARNAAGEFVDKVKGAASDTAEDVRDDAEKRGFTPSGVKDMARGAAGDFADKVKSGGDEPSATAGKPAGAKSSPGTAGGGTAGGGTA